MDIMDKWGCKRISYVEACKYPTLDIAVMLKFSFGMPICRHVQKARCS